MHFYKYQGTGNDFVMLDDRKQEFDIKNSHLVKLLCDRRFGIGADGLILLRNSNEAQFEMIYFNSDGNLSSMCGNGGRCIARFAQQLGIIETKVTFKAIDGIHQASLTPNEVSLKMNDVTTVENNQDYLFLNTGSPHLIKFVSDLDTLDILTEARKYRYNERFRELGTNVNFIQRDIDQLKIRTYERGVEDETLSCGTGITAAAIANIITEHKSAGSYQVKLHSRGGELQVLCNYDGKETFEHVYLIGAAEYVFDGNF